MELVNKKMFAWGDQLVSDSENMKIHYLLTVLIHFSESLKLDWC